MSGSWQWIALIKTVDFDKALFDAVFAGANRWRNTSSHWRLRTYRSNCPLMNSFLKLDWRFMQAAGRWYGSAGWKIRLRQKAAPGGLVTESRVLFVPDEREFNRIKVVAGQSKRWAYNGWTCAQPHFEKEEEEGHYFCRKERRCDSVGGLKRAILLKQWTI